MSSLPLHCGIGEVGVGCLLELIGRRHYDNCQNIMVISFRGWDSSLDAYMACMGHYETKPSCIGVSHSKK